MEFSFISFFSFSQIYMYFFHASFISVQTCELTWMQQHPTTPAPPYQLFMFSLHLFSFGLGCNFQSLLPTSFPPDGAVLVQTRAAQRLVARAGLCGALGGCVSLYPHLWDGLRLSVVSTPHALPPL